MRRLAPAVISALVLVACGGSSDDAGDESVEQLPEVAAGEPAPDAVDEDAVVEPAAEAAPAPSDAAGSTFARFSGLDVQPASEIESNRLPSVVVDNVTTGEQVNVRNLVPQDRPILLWMYAPH